MSNKRYTEELKIDPLRQMVDRGYNVAETVRRLGTTTHGSLIMLQKHRWN